MLIRSVYSRGTTSPGGGGAVTLDMRSDWAAQLVGATSDAAILDGVWDEFGFSGTKSVQDAAGSGLPAAFTRYARFNISSGGNVDASSWVSKFNLAQPANGGSRWWRVYTLFHVPDACGAMPSGAHHPIENYHGDCPFLWEFKWGANADGTMQSLFCTRNKNYIWGGGSNDHWLKDTWYRLEWQFKNWDPVAKTCQLDLRVYDMAGTQVAQASDWANGGTSLAADNPTISLDPTTQAPGSTDALCITRMTFGTNGPGSSWAGSVGQGCYQAFAGAASSLQGWIGPYAVGY